MRKPLLMVALAITIQACNENSGPDNDGGDPNGLKPTSDITDQTPDTPTNATPRAALSASTDGGTTPLWVQLDASASTDADHDTSLLIVQWDIEGDGIWDAVRPTSTLPLSFTLDVTYFEPGEYRPKVKIIDPEGAYSVAELSSPIKVTLPSTNPTDPPDPDPETAPVANLSVDANRDGAITSGDELNEDSYTEAFGAIVIANFDDDDNDGEFDALDTVVNGAEDIHDMARVILRPTGNGDTSYDVQLFVSPAPADEYIRIWAPSGGGNWEVLYEPGGPSTGVALDPAALASETYELRIEALRTRLVDWDGRFTLTLSITKNDALVSSDSVELRVAPVVLPDNTLRAKRLFVMETHYFPSDEFDASNTAMLQTINANLPSGVTFEGVSEYQYDSDRWVQDTMQGGYQTMPGPDGITEMMTHLVTTRYRPLIDWLPDEKFGPDVGYWFSGGQESSHSYGGNLEVAPSHEGYPLGRILVGGGSQGSILGTPNYDTMTPQQRNWLDAQDVQGPSLELSSEWLAVGHIDEIFMFIPAPNRPKGFALVIVSPAMARNILVDLDNAGKGYLTVFENTIWEMTVADIVDDDDLRDYNQAVQTRVDSIRARLMSEMDLDDDDVIEVPVMYEYELYGSGPGGALDLAAALNPGIQNLITTSDTLFIPDPVGPVDGGRDVWKAMTDEGLDGLGVEWHYVDVFHSYHVLLGEAHCGSAVERKPHTTPWWQLAAGGLQ